MQSAQPDRCRRWPRISSSGHGWAGNGRSDGKQVTGLVLEGTTPEVGQTPLAADGAATDQEVEVGHGHLEKGRVARKLLTEIAQQAARGYLGGDAACRRGVGGLIHRGKYSS
jgi:hypothetical protein